MSKPELPSRELTLHRSARHWDGHFTAMANPCEVLCQCDDAATAREMTRRAAGEAWRIESKFSRYRPEGVVFAINNAGGRGTVLDEESTRLIAYGDELWRLSEGRFDITSGVLRRAWRFEPGAIPPDPARVGELLQSIGWSKAHWHPPNLTLPAGMEIDLGGIGKEYAVDRAVEMLNAGWPQIPALVNFGGDLRVSGPVPREGAWNVGIESPVAAEQAARAVQLSAGALATSGDARRHIWANGRRYGHILDARTGWPTPGAPRSVTVAAATCSLAGTFSTLAMLLGTDAEAFLASQNVRYWCLR